ncbi:MAG: alpha/beta fold hydrolase [Thiogranum sp.]
MEVPALHADYTAEISVPSLTTCLALVSLGQSASYYIRMNEEMGLDLLEIEPAGPPSCAVIWLHGLGADGHDFEPLVQQWGLADKLSARFILPHAPRRPVTLNGGMVMRAWYDIYTLGVGAGEDRLGIEQAHQFVVDLIRREQQRGIRSDRILLAGFSQGGAVALHTALRYRGALAGVLALSSYLPLAELLAAEKCADPASLVIRMDHGDQDPVVSFTVAERSRDMMESQGYKVEFHRYPMAHGLCVAQTESLRNWIVRRLE